MQLREVMTHEVEVMRPDASLQQAAQTMKELDVGLLPVCDGDRLVGMISDRDIAIRAIADGCDPRQTKVSDIMSPDVVYCFEDEDVDDAANLMNTRQIRRLPILNRSKRLTGIVSLGDIAVRTRDKDLAGETLEGVSEPSKH